MRTHDTVTRQALLHAARKNTAIRGTDRGRAYIFTGTCVGGDDTEGNQLALTLAGKRACINGDYWGKLDPTYKSHPGNKNFVRYVGFNGYYEEYAMWLLVEKPLINGAAEGTIKLQGRGEGFFNAVYHCIREG